MAVVMSEGPAISDRAIQKRAVVFSITLGAWGISKKIRSSQIEVDADKELVKGQKLLLDCEEVRRIQSLDGEIRRYAEARAVPGPLKRGLDLLPTELLEQTEAAMKSYQQQRIEYVQALGEVWNQRVGETALKLRTLFDHRDYPNWAAVERRYFFFWSYAHLANPDALLPPDIAKRNREQMDQMWRDTALGVEELLHGTLLDLVAHMEDKLTGSREGGKPKVFRDSSVQNIQDFLATFNARNLTDSTKLKAAADKVKELLTNSTTGQYWPAEALRDSETLRATVRQGFAGIKNELTAAIVDAPKRRKFDFSE